jgi:hypothetical protein
MIRSDAHEIPERTRSSGPPCALVAAASLLTCSPLQAQETQSVSGGSTDAVASSSQGAGEAASSAEALQKATQNPVADLISVPLQNNVNLGIGPYDRIQNVLNIQPVIPAHLSENWNLITRVIQPIVFQPYTDATSGGNFGLGDMNPTFLLTPGKPGNVIWGVGPAFVFPTATYTSLGQGKWSAGPSFVVLAQPGHWTLGAIANNVWSFAGESNRATVNQFFVQYFVNYNLSNGWYLTSAPIVTANWAASSAKNVWTVPFGGGVGRIMKVGFQPINLQLSAYANAWYPSGTSPWGIRLQIAFLFPKLTPKEQILLMEEKLQEMKKQEGLN